MGSCTSTSKVNKKQPIKKENIIENNQNSQQNIQKESQIEQNQQNPNEKVITQEESNNKNNTNINNNNTKENIIKNSADIDEDNLTNYELNEKSLKKQKQQKQNQVYDFNGNINQQTINKKNNQEKINTEQIPRSNENDKEKTKKEKVYPSKKINYKKGQLIDEGAFGKVYEGIDLDTGKFLAIKSVKIQGKYEEIAKEIQNLKNEISVLKSLEHQNIVKYYSFEISPDYSGIDIVLEYVPGGSLKQLLQKFGKFDERLVCIYAAQILEGLQYLHKNGILHRDIKGANILIDAEGNIKLTDFGTSKQIKQLDPKISEQVKDDVHLSKSFKGSPYWMAPEIIRRTGHTLSADIWSIGCLVIELLQGEPPYQKDVKTREDLKNILINKISKGIKPDYPSDITDNCKQFLDACLQSDPSKRPTANQLQEFEWIQLADPINESKVSQFTLTLGSVMESKHFKHLKLSQLSQMSQVSHNHLNVSQNQSKKLATLKKSQSPNLYNIEEENDQKADTLKKNQNLGLFQAQSADNNDINKKNKQQQQIPMVKFIDQNQNFIQSQQQVINVQNNENQEVNDDKVLKISDFPRLVQQNNQKNQGILKNSNSNNYNKNNQNSVFKRVYSIDKEEGEEDNQEKNNENHINNLDLKADEDNIIQFSNNFNNNVQMSALKNKNQNNNNITNQDQQKLYQEFKQYQNQQSNSKNNKNSSSNLEQDITNIDEKDTQETNFQEFQQRQRNIEKSLKFDQQSIQSKHNQMERKKLEQENKKLEQQKKEKELKWQQELEQEKNRQKQKTAENAITAQIELLKQKKQQQLKQENNNK